MINRLCVKFFKEKILKGKNFSNMKNKKFRTKQCLKFNGGFWWAMPHKK